MRRLAGLMLMMLPSLAGAQAIIVSRKPDKVAVTCAAPLAGTVTRHSARSASLRSLAMLSCAIRVSPHSPSWTRSITTAFGLALVRS